MSCSLSGNVSKAEVLNSVNCSALLDSIRIALLVFNRSAEIVHANPAARQLISSRDWLWIADKKLKCHGKQPMELERCIHNSLALERTMVEDRVVVLGGSRQASPLLLRFSAVTSLDSSTLTLCSIVDPAADHQTDISGLRDVYALTDAEVDVTSLIVRGKNYKEIASTRNVTISTVRSFTKSIFKKLNVSSRAGVIHKVQAASFQLGLLK